MTQAQENTALTAEQKSFYLLFLGIVILIYSPFKIALLPLPLLFATLGFRYRLVTARSFIYILLYLLAGLGYFFVNPDFLWINWAVFFLTTSHFLVFTLTFRRIVNEALLLRINRLLINVAVFEAFVGFLQFMYGAAVAGGLPVSVGDNVQGTLTLSLAADGSGSNNMFAILQSCIAVIHVSLSLSLKRRPELLKLSIVAISWLIAMVMHTLVMAALALILSMLLLQAVPYIRNGPYARAFRRFRWTIYVALLAMGLLLMQVFRNNMASFITVFRTISFSETTMGANTKILATFNTLVFLPEDKPSQRYIGLGPGQYTSRASFIMSGKFLSKPLPVSSLSPDLDRYIMPIWEPYFYKKKELWGSSFFPYYSWLTLYGEFGLAGMVLVLLLALRYISRLKKHTRKAPFIVLALLFLLIYVLLLGFQENYWEWTQPFLLIFLLSKMFFDFLEKKDVTSPEAS